ncbi:nucleotide disphospho-sugar-binding domain-containing protein [Micromonospora halophytica]|uniref:UDP:flavonoid glycosyltransferase YjiC, YdhE family n=1 Tax=Micromonospora halophytica TaxID=47864 RepID=A0A1C5HHL2_9ACTN|nr:nucleotide disphospho-sugar-binding domain-containing protein [Micromonospora halophytica]SCG45367.1 UDP:flavonoid glycosyltransferase YjiC, YdhE family [Micromonospora halophytica]
MRVLVVSAPMTGHVLPMVPLAVALRDAGHDVLVASAADGLPGPDVGLPVRDVAPRFAFGPIARSLLLRHPLLARAELAGTAGTRGAARLFGRVNDQLADGLVALARQWRPDLVVHEPLAVAGALAAARVGVPAVRQENSLFDGRELVRATTERLGGALARHGLSAVPSPAAAIAVAPPSVLTQQGWPMRYAAHGGAGELPDWLREPGDRSRILVSRSTVAGPGAAGPMRAVVAAAQRVDADFVLVRPEPRLARAGLPRNVRTVGWIPLGTALTAGAALVHHGGAGSVYAALAAGAPQLATVGPGDRRHNAELVAARGAGLAAPVRAVTAALLTRLVTDGALASAAREVAGEMATMPAPAELVPRLEALV